MADREVTSHLGPSHHCHHGVTKTQTSSSRARHECFAGASGNSLLPLFFLPENLSPTPPLHGNHGHHQQNHISLQIIDWWPGIHLKEIKTKEK